LLYPQRIYSNNSPCSCTPVYLKPAGLGDGAAVLAVLQEIISEPRSSAAGILDFWRHATKKTTG
jgi:hypothetical protein